MEFNMKLLPLPLILSLLITLTACSDSNSVDSMNEQSANSNTEQSNMGAVDGMSVDSETESSMTTNETTDTATTNTNDTADSGQTGNTDTTNTGTGETTSTDDGGTTDTGTEQTANTDEGATTITAGEEATTGTDAGSTTDTGGDTQTTDEMIPVEPAEMFADYRITFEATWSAATHATQFPSNPHFSGLVGAVHNDQVIFWEPGQIATGGIELMAETGGKAMFLDEINSAIDSGYALSAIDGPGVTVSPGSASIELRVTVDYPNVTLATMLAPSPDWFAGFHDIRLLDNGVFIDGLTVEGILYDSGTDSGVSFTSSDNDTQPRGTIVRTTSEPSDSPFIEGLPTVGRFIIEKL